jgi:hypothetical protein
VGVEAQPILNSDPREQLSASSVSAALVETSTGSIAWVNWRYSPWDSSHDSYLDFGVPDPRLSSYDLGQFLLDVLPPSWLSRLRFVNVARWRGRDANLGVLLSLKQATTLNKEWGTLHGPEVRILAHSGSLSLWRLAVAFHPGLMGGWVNDPRDAIRWQAEWGCLESLARHLLGTALPTS